MTGRKSRLSASTLVGCLGTVLALQTAAGGPHVDAQAAILPDADGGELLGGLVDPPVHLAQDPPGLAVLARDPGEVDLAPGVVVLDGQAALGPLAVRSGRLLLADDGLALETRQAKRTERRRVFPGRLSVRPIA